MNNISGVRSCYGCGVCGLACGQKIIEIRLNREGFYEPYIAMKPVVQIVVFVQMYVLICMKIFLQKTI